MATLIEMTDEDYSSGRFQILSCTYIQVDNPLENNAPWLSDNGLRMMLREEGLMKKILSSAPKEAVKWAPAAINSDGDMRLIGGSLMINYYQAA